MESESYDWRASVKREIIAASITPVHFDRYDTKSFVAYEQDPARAIHRYHRSVKRRRIALPAAWATTGAGAISLILSLVFTVIASSEPLSQVDAMIEHSTLAVNCLITGAVLLFAAGFWKVILDYTPAVCGAVFTLNHYPQYYLPNVEYEQVDGGVQVSLGDEHQTYASRIFNPHDVTGALEYQVELESTINEVRAERQAQFVNAVTSAAQPTLEQTPEPQDTQLTLSMHAEDNEAATELQELLRSGRQQHQRI